MKSVGDILDKKGRYVWSVRPDSTVYDTVKLMADKGIGGVVVMDDDKLVGIITERDYARKIILEDRSSRNSKVSDVMTGQVVWVTEAETLDECMALMIEKNLRHLPVMKDDEVIGVVSIRDLVQTVVKEQRVLIDHLQSYITSPY